MTECEICASEFDRVDGLTVVSQGKMWLFCSEPCKQQWIDDTQ